MLERLAPLDLSVLLLGETGTGKSSVAQALHEQSPRREGPFVVVNCGAISANLMESAFFGHEKGAFTGADSLHRGYLEQANGGTLFLDEIGELSLELQPKLLDVLERKRIKRLGGESEIKVDFRLVSATHRVFPEHIKQGFFREDLFYRINVIDVEVPSLAQRRDDIPDLVINHLSRLAADEGFEALVVSDAAMERLINNHYPGNVRQLENILPRAAAMAESGVIEEDVLEISPVPVAMVAEEAQPSPIEAAEQDQKSLLAQVDGDLDGHLEAIEREILTEAMTAHRWNRTAAAEALGVSFRSLRYRLKKLGLDD